MLQLKLWTIFRALSQVLNAVNAALFWEKQDFETLPRPEDVTFSAYIGYKSLHSSNRVWKYWERLVNKLFWRQPYHCFKAYQRERASFHVKS